MRVLALDTATAATAVALLDSDAAGPAAAGIERRDDPPADVRPRHTSRLMALVVDVLAAAGCGWADIDRLAVGTGPGTFTGLRIGVATAQALAEARGLPLVGVSTLHSLAAAAATAADAPAEGDLVVAVIDARRGEVSAAGWAMSDAATAGARPMIPPQAVAPETLARTLAGRPERCLAVGDGAVKFRAALEPSGARIPESDSERHRVSAIQHCHLALGAAAEPADGVRPEYLRPPDAEASMGAGRPR